jgi:hypothetical protein
MKDKKPKYTPQTHCLSCNRKSKTVLCKPCSEKAKRRRKENKND